MKIKDNQNLKYDQKPIEYFEGRDIMDPDKCILEDCRMIEGALELNFQNGSRAFIRGRNPEGSREVEVIARKVNDLSGESYADILEFDF